MNVFTSSLHVSQGGRTPLHEACYGGRVETARVLLESGADINAVDKVSLSLSKPHYSLEGHHHLACETE